MSHSDKKPHQFPGFGMAFSCELLALSPVPHVGFGAVDAGLSLCGDIFQLAVIWFRGAPAKYPSKAGPAYFLKPNCHLGLPDSVKWVTCFHEEKGGQISTKSPF